MWVSSQTNLWVQLHTHPACGGLVGACILVVKTGPGCESLQSETEKNSGVMGLFCAKLATFPFLHFASALTMTE